jgi:putative hydrolase of the HAD superfamily
MVGNNLESDIGGARGAGLTAVWFNPQGDPRPDNPDLQPHAELQDFSDLPELLERL